jgi:hypothetical protein
MSQSGAKKTLLNEERRLIKQQTVKQTTLTKHYTGSQTTLDCIEEEADRRGRGKEQPKKK